MCVQGLSNLKNIQDQLKTLPNSGIKIEGLFDGDQLVENPTEASDLALAAGML